MTNTQFRVWLENKIKNTDEERQYYVKKALDETLKEFNDLCESDVDEIKFD